MLVLVFYFLLISIFLLLLLLCCTVVQIKITINLFNMHKFAQNFVARGNCCFAAHLRYRSRISYGNKIYSSSSSKTICHWRSTAHIAEIFRQELIIIAIATSFHSRTRAVTADVCRVTIADAVDVVWARRTDGNCYDNDDDNDSDNDSSD